MEQIAELSDDEILSLAERTIGSVEIEERLAEELIEFVRRLLAIKEG